MRTHILCRWGRQKSWHNGVLHILWSPARRKWEPSRRSRKETIRMPQVLQGHKLPFQRTCTTTRHHNVLSLTHRASQFAQCNYYNPLGAAPSITRTPLVLIHFSAAQADLSLRFVHELQSFYAMKNEKDLRTLDFNQEAKKCKVSHPVRCESPLRAPTDIKLECSTRHFASVQ